jgi:hypothetical protein
MPGPSELHIFRENQADMITQHWTQEWDMKWGIGPKQCPFCMQHLLFLAHSSVSPYSYPIHCLSESIMGRPVETKSQQARRALAKRKSRISEGVNTIMEARKLGDKRGISTILKN